MHEMALTESMVNIIEEQAAAQNFRTVKTVWLEIGRLCQVEPEAVRFCFDAVTRGTLAQGAKLEIIRTPGQGFCMDCSESVRVGERYDPCPHCGSHKVRLTDGEDLRIKQLEVE